MTKHEEFNLIFNGAGVSDGRTISFVNSPVTTNPYSALCFINALDQNEIQYFIDNIALATAGNSYDPNFYIVTGTEAFSIRFNEPNFNIEGLTISMTDLRQLLQEWMTYLTASNSHTPRQPNVNIRFPNLPSSKLSYIV